MVEFLGTIACVALFISGIVYLFQILFLIMELLMGTDLLKLSKKDFKILLIPVYPVIVILVNKYKDLRDE